MTNRKMKIQVVDMKIRTKVPVGKYCLCHRTMNDYCDNLCSVTDTSDDDFILKERGAKYLEKKPSRMGHKNFREGWQCKYSENEWLKSTKNNSKVWKCQKCLDVCERGANK